MYHIHNFNLESGSHVHLTPNNRGLQYGDGLFETMIVRDGNIRFLNDHYGRFMDGLEAFRMRLPDTFSLQYLERAINDLLQKNNLNKDARLKLMAWRTWGGTYVPETNEAEFLLSSYPYSPPSLTTKSAGFYEDYRLTYSPVSAFKTLGGLPYVMAGIAMKERRHEDMILLGAHNRVVECIHSNIYWINDNTVYTPSLESGCVNGVSRRQILKKLEQESIAYEEDFYDKAALLEADAVFSSNATGIKVIHKVEDIAFSHESPIIEKLRTIF